MSTTAALAETIALAEELEIKTWFFDATDRGAMGALYTEPTDWQWFIGGSR